MMDVYDDDASHSTCATNSSDEGIIDDDDCVEYSDEAFDMIERNSPLLEKLELCPYDPAPPPREWVSLGNNIGRNTFLRELNLSVDGLDDGEDISSKENLEAFCTGLSHNRSLAYIMIQEYNFCRASLETLHPFVVKNDNLANMQLHSCQMRPEDIERLADAFSRRANPSSIKSVGISGTTIGDECVPAIIGLCNQCPQLRKLDLGWSYVGNEGCRALAPFLERQNSRVKCIKLNNSRVGNEGAIVLANSISSNETLKRLDLSKCEVDTTGWEGFLSILSNASSINATNESNHMLQRLWRSFDDYQEMGLSNGMGFCLQSNMELNKRKVARKKIFHFHLNGNFNLAPFLTMDIDILPAVLGWVGKDYSDCWGEIKRKRCAVFYRILRNFPELCSFPAHDRKMRLLLEKENAGLKSDVALLRQQVEELKAENEELRSSKRPRKG